MEKMSSPKSQNTWLSDEWEEWTTCSKGLRGSISSHAFGSGGVTNQIIKTAEVYACGI